MNETRALTDHEIHTLLAATTPRTRVLFLTGLYFGTRISEALALHFRDVSGTFLTFRSKKHSANRTFDIPAAYMQEVQNLRAYYQAQGRVVTADTPLFLSREGRNRPISRQQASHILITLRQALSLDGCVNTHSFRKSFTLKIWDLCGHNLPELQRYTRHKNIANTGTYLKSAQGTPLIHHLTWGDVT